MTRGFGDPVNSSMKISSVEALPSRQNSANSWIVLEKKVGLDNCDRSGNVLIVSAGRQCEITTEKHKHHTKEKENTEKYR